MSTSKTLTTRTFGLEFEHISSLDIGQLRSLLEHNDISLESAQSHRDRTYSGWQVKGDGSISAQEKYPYGIELTTPPLVQKDFQQVVKAVGLAKQHGGVNASCGLHVHVAAPELVGVLVTHSSHEWQEYVVRSWQAVEPVLFSYIPMSRRTSTYCRPGIQWATKYMAINFSPLHDTRRTIEFRLHNSTLNPVKAFAFAILCRNFVDALVNKQVFAAIKPDVLKATTPRLIHTRHGGEFYLQRDETGKWLIECKNLKVETDLLAVACKDHRKQLRLDSKKYLPAFHYPHYGNAMGDLCESLMVNGMFRSFMEDRYDHITKKFGVIGAKALKSKPLTDEDDFYHEPDYDSSGIGDDNDGDPLSDEDADGGEDDSDPEERDTRF